MGVSLSGPHHQTHFLCPSVRASWECRCQVPSSTRCTSGRPCGRTAPPPHRILRVGLHVAPRAPALPLGPLCLLQPEALLRLPPRDVLWGDYSSIGAGGVVVGAVCLVVARRAVELGLVLVEGGGGERLRAGLALHALLVEGRPVAGHDGLGSEDGHLAGGALGGRRRS